MNVKFKYDVGDTVFRVARGTLIDLRIAGHTVAECRYLRSRKSADPQEGIFYYLSDLHSVPMHENELFSTGAEALEYITNQHKRGR